MIILLKIYKYSFSITSFAIMNLFNLENLSLLSCLFILLGLLFLIIGILRKKLMLSNI